MNDKTTNPVMKQALKVAAMLRHRGAPDTIAERYTSVEDIVDADTGIRTTIETTCFPLNGGHGHVINYTVSPPSTDDAPPFDSLPLDVRRQWLAQRCETAHREFMAADDMRTAALRYAKWQEWETLRKKAEAEAAPTGGAEVRMQILNGIITDIAKGQAAPADVLGEPTPTVVETPKRRGYEWL